MSSRLSLLAQFPVLKVVAGIARLQVDRLPVAARPVRQGRAQPPVVVALPEQELKVRVPRVGIPAEHLPDGREVARLELDPLAREERVLQGQAEAEAM